MSVVLSRFYKVLKAQGNRSKICNYWSWAITAILISDIDFDHFFNWCIEYFIIRMSLGLTQSLEGVQVLLQQNRPKALPFHYQSCLTAVCVVFVLIYCFCLGFLKMYHILTLVPSFLTHFLKTFSDIPTRSGKENRRYSLCFFVFFLFCTQVRLETSFYIF